MSRKKSLENPPGAIDRRNNRARMAWLWCSLKSEYVESHPAASGEIRRRADDDAGKGNLNEVNLLSVRGAF